MKISIAIPAYCDSNYRGDLFLKELLNSTLSQTYKNFEIIISDHSVGNEILDAFNDFIKNNLDIDIKYFRFEEKRGNISANTNNAIRNCVGEIIKIMHIDDKFCNDDTLLLILEAIKNNSDKKWGVCSFNHFYIAENVTRDIYLASVFGAGNPSTSFFARNPVSVDLYDEEYRYMLDGKFHIDLQEKYGDPLIMDDVCVTIGMHEHKAGYKYHIYEKEERKRLKH